METTRYNDCELAKNLSENWRNAHHWKSSTIWWIEICLHCKKYWCIPSIIGAIPSIQLISLFNRIQNWPYQREWIIVTSSVTLSVSKLVQPLRWCVTRMDSQNHVFIGGKTVIQSEDEVCTYAFTVANWNFLEPERSMLEYILVMQATKLEILTRASGMFLSPSDSRIILPSDWSKN